MTQDGKDVSACAPQKDVCGSCEARFYAKQQFLVCSAGCNRRFYCKCLSVTHEEYNFYMKSGTSAFKCSGCTRRSSASPRNDAAAGIGGVVPAPVAFVEPSNVTLDDGSVPPALLRLIESLSSKLDIVTAELKCLRADNNSLRSEVLHLRKSVHERMPLPSSSSTMYASVVALPPAAPTSALRPRAAESLLNTVPGTNLGGAGLESSPSSGARAAGEKDAVDDGYTTVGPRRRTKPSAGTAKPSKVTAVPRKNRRLALFVSRLDPDTSVDDVLALIEPLVAGRQVLCSKMFTRFDTYSSFHISGDESVFDAINKSEVWPEGSIFHQFFGRLDKSRVHTDDGVENVHDAQT